jgi:SAM-dependent methyltransferase
VFRRRQRREEPADPDGEGSFPFYCIETPQGIEPAIHSIALRGWIAVPPTATVVGPWLEHGRRVEIVGESRPDVEAVFPDWQIVAFRDFLNVADEGAASSQWQLAISVDGRELRTELVNVRPDRDGWLAFEAAKRKKLKRIESLLRCPAGGDTDQGSLLGRCLGELTPLDAGHLECSRCGRRFTRSARNFDFLDDKIGETYTTTENPRYTGYGDPRIRDAIREVREADGLVLDNGSGFKHAYLENVVNVDIVSYATTDVLGIGERLPFADETFDAVLSFSVLEHVRDPFECAAEIRRVLKPGGMLHVSVPHLAPYHGFPSHYYNMTRQGLEALFDEGFHVESSETPDWGHPIWALTWMVKLYADALPPGTREEFGRLQVDALMGQGAEYQDRSFVTELDADTRRVLACNNYLIARKTGRSN